MNSNSAASAASSAASVASSADRPALSVSHLSYIYPDNDEKALDDISLDIFPGEKIAVIGANGAGKTTFFLHLGAVIKSRPGTVRLFGTDIGQMTVKERIGSIGIVFADPEDQLFMPTVYDNVSFGPINMGLSEDDVKDRVSRALEQVGIADLASKVSHHLSLGQKKKVALAAVLSMDPRILVLDEPTANLDPHSKKEIIRIIESLHAAGTTTIIATHDVDLLSKMADRVFVLNKKIVRVGTPAEIFADDAVLNENGLEAPDIYNFFRVLSRFGLDAGDPPLTFDEAVERLFSAAEKNDGTICLRADEKTRAQVADIVESGGFSAGGKKD